MRLPFLNGLRAFEAAARLGGYAAAAAEMNISASAVSRMVKLLEERLGVTLFLRRANGLDLTPQGAAYLAEIGDAFARITRATDRLQAGAAAPLLIGAGPTLAMRWLIPRLPRFQARFPDIDVRLSTALAGAEPLGTDWIAGIRMGNGAWHGLDAHFLFTADLFPVCTPDLAARMKSPRDLGKAALLQVTSAPEDWLLWLKAAKLPAPDFSHMPQFDYPAFALQAALDGLGVAMARAPFVADDLAAGRLVRPFSLAVPKGKGWYFIHRQEDAGNPALIHLRTWLQEQAAAMARSAGQERP